MAVATSSSQEHALGNLEKEGILGYFQAVITGNMVSRGKPWPEIYEKACRALDLPQETESAEIPVQSRMPQEQDPGTAAGLQTNR